MLSYNILLPQNKDNIKNIETEISIGVYVSRKNVVMFHKINFKWLKIIYKSFLNIYDIKSSLTNIFVTCKLQPDYNKIVFRPTSLF